MNLEDRFWRMVEKTSTDWAIIAVIVTDIALLKVIRTLQRRAVSA